MSTPPTLSAPTQDPARLSQPWGAWPEYYAQFTYGGAPLRGHNGIDLALPVGTPVLAVDAGQVMGTGYEAGGFGNWIKLRHAWGESIYAHLLERTPILGDQVAAGQEIARSGNTGGSTGPHLHLGIRLDPYQRGDGWGGCVDPLPLLPPASVYAGRGDHVNPSALAESEEDRP